MIRFSRFFLLGLPVALFVAFFGVTSANAASVFDNTINIADDLIIMDTIGNGSRDYSKDWFTEAVEALTVRCDGPGPGENCANKSMLASMLDDDDANWAIIKPNPYEYRIIFSHDPTARVEFFDLGNGNTEARIVADTPQSIIYTNTFYLLSNNPSNGTSNGTVYGSNASFDFYDTGSIGASWNPNWKVWLSTFPITYPQGYEGDLIPDSYNPRAEYDVSPDLFVVNGLDHKITIRDRRWFTFDNPDRKTCSEGLVPIVKFQIHNSDDVLIIEDVFSPTLEYVFNAPDINQPMDYRMTAYYDCGDSVGEPIFTSQIILYFHITKEGIYVNNVMDICMPGSLDSIDINGCMDSIAAFFDMLTFDLLPFSSGWSYNGGCRNLVTLGAWIHKPGVQVCPFFPEYVRSVVTPFVSFLLGLLMMKFIASRGGHGF